MKVLFEDFRYAVRNLRRSRSLWVSGAVVLALGVGATTAMFALIDAVILRPRDYRPSDRLVIIRERRPTGDGLTIAPAEFSEWRQGIMSNGPFVRMASFYRDTVTVSRGQEPERVNTAAVSSGFFEVLEASLHAGRTFSIDDEKPGGAAVAIVSQQLWQRHFGGAPLDGQFLQLDDVPVQVVGITKPPFAFPENSHIWRPMRFDPARPIRTHVLTVIARLKGGDLAAAAQDHLQVINARAASAGPNAQVHAPRILTLHHALLGELRFALSVLFAAVFMVLLLACCSVASVLLARAAKAQSQLALLMALGASRARLIRQSLFETLVLAMCAGAAGLLLSAMALRLVLALYPDALPGLASVPLNGAQMVFAVSAAAAAAVVSSVLPAVQSTRVESVRLLRDVGTTVVGGRRHMIRGLLISAQTAIALVLMFGAGLFITTFDNLRSTDPGFDATGVISVPMNLPAPRYSGPRIPQFYSAFFERLQAVPGVSEVGAVLSLPLRGGRGTRALWIPGPATSGSGELSRANVNIVSAGYFTTMRIPLLSGRDFTTSETTASNVVVINETLARRFSGGGNPVGRQIRFDDPAGAPAATIVGVTGDVRQSRLQELAEPEVYFPGLRSPRLTVVVRTTLADEAASAAIRNILQQLDPGLPISLQPLGAVVAATIGVPALRAAVLSLLAAAALLIAAVGLAGFVAFRVGERIPELGLRTALGGQPRQIFLTIVRRELTWPLIGLVTGVIAALSATRVVESLLYEVSPVDTAILAAVVGVMFAAMVLSAIFPARRVFSVSPLILVRRL